MSPKRIWKWLDALESIQPTRGDALQVEAVGVGDAGITARLEKAYPEEAEELEEEAHNFFGEWADCLLEELLQGRGIVANLSFKGGFSLSREQANQKAYITGCIFEGPSAT